MTDKKQIIIDGVDVSECGNWCTLKECFGYRCAKWNILKAQQEKPEKEDLKQQLDRYKQALGQIEDICNVSDRYEQEEFADEIFDIISEVKDER